MAPTSHDYDIPNQYLYNSSNKIFQQNMTERILVSQTDSIWTEKSVEVFIRKIECF